MSKRKFHHVDSDEPSSSPPTSPVCYLIYRIFEHPEYKYEPLEGDEKQPGIFFHGTDVFHTKAAANQECLNLAKAFAGNHNNAEIRYQQGWEGLGRCVVETREYVLDKETAEKLRVRAAGGRGKRILRL